MEILKRLCFSYFFSFPKLDSLFSILFLFYANKSSSPAACFITVVEHSRDFQQLNGHEVGLNAVVNVAGFGLSLMG